MKPASPAAQTILAAGQVKRIDLYSITLPGSTATFNFTSHQTAVTVGGVLYQTGYVITRGSIKTTNTLQVQSMTVTMSPNPKNSAGVPLIAGFPLLTAVQMRILDGSRLQFWKMFLSDYTDLSPGTVEFFDGRIGPTKLGRLSVEFTVNDHLQTLNLQMPRNVIQKKCVHTLFDAGCGLLASAFQVSGTVASGSTVLAINTNLTQVDHYFRLGRLTFLTGANATNPSTTYYVKDYLNASGQLQLIRPLPNVPTAGDTFVVLPGCKHTMAACQNTNPANGPPLNNFKRYRGIPYVPPPETLYDGGTTQVPAPTLGSDGTQITGSPFGSGIGQRGIYKS